MVKLLENDVIKILVKWLKSEGWNEKEPSKFGHAMGKDIFVERNGQEFIIEVKGARGNPKDKNVTRKKFSRGQIKTHFGVAIIKILEERSKHPNAIFAIAHPNDEDIKQALKNSIGCLKTLGIKHFWVSKEKVTEGYL